MIDITTPTHTLGKQLVELFRAHGLPDDVAVVGATFTASEARLETIKSPAMASRWPLTSSTSAASPTDVPELLDDIIAVLQRRCTPADITLTVDGDEVSIDIRTPIRTDVRKIQPVGTGQEHRALGHLPPGL